MATGCYFMLRTAELCFFLVEQAEVQCLAAEGTRDLHFALELHPQCCTIDSKSSGGTRFG
jgi:hypothetical protein